MKPHAILHASFLVQDLARARAFYEGVLGLVPNPERPDLGYEGVWYDVGEQQLHLLALESPDLREGRPAHGGHDRHVAFAVEDMAALEAALAAAGVPYTRSRSGRVALFLRDPDGNALEFIEIRNRG
jgi:glyoxylase I family protein